VKSKFEEPPLFQFLPEFPVMILMETEITAFIVNRLGNHPVWDEPVSEELIFPSLEHLELENCYFCPDTTAFSD